MVESDSWELRRCGILLVVLTLHAALFAALLLTSRTGSRQAPTTHSVELLFLPPVPPQKVRAEFVAARRLSADLALKVVPSEVHFPTLAMAAPPAGSSDGTGSRVDWAAEARRALQAFEIRNHEPPRNDAISSAPREDDWWPRTAHRAGDEFKTPNGDWIVWINASCYRVAGTRPSGYAPGATLSHAICIGRSGAAAN